MPADGPWSTVVAFLEERTGDPPGVARRVAAGEVLLDDGTPVVPGTAYRPGVGVHLHRDLPVETEVAERVRVLHQDDDLVVVDKPHFLATTPRGRHVVQTALVQVSRELGLPDLAPAHRLDRLTAGVLLLTARPAVRAAYQQLFATGQVAKTYLAVAPVRSGMNLPVTVQDRLVKPRGSLQSLVVAGEPNARSTVELLATRGGAGLYRLTPHTGRTHQLRVHMAGLGIPIVGDPLYPDVLEDGAEDLTRPLQLLAHRLAFPDPLDGSPRCFTSGRRVAW
jgi:tRNA pseudouridine32 synthase / 23S rRNA pseudouridine746 synthase